MADRRTARAAGHEDMSTQPDTFDPRERLPQADRPSSGRASAVIVFFGLGLAAAILHGIVPKFTQVYDEVDVPMPTMTAWLFDASRLLTAAWWLWFIPPLVPIWMWKNRVSTPPLALVLVLGILAGCGLTVVALFLPLIGQLQSIGGKH